MNCPHCSAELAPHLGECPQCRFSVAAIRSLLGADWVRLDRLTDTANCLSLKEQRHLEIVLDDFERAFPQCFCAVYLGSLTGAITARDLGFWLINHGAFPTQQIAKRNDFGCALVIDCGRQVASVTLGYALEKHLLRSDLEESLNQSRPYLKVGRYGQAVERMVAFIAKKLSRAGTRVDTPPSADAPASADLGGLGLQPLRAAHRQTRPAAHG